MAVGPGAQEGIKRFDILQRPHLCQIPGMNQDVAVRHLDLVVERLCVADGNDPGHRETVSGLMTSDSRRNGRVRGAALPRRDAVFARRRRGFGHLRTR